MPRILILTAGFGEGHNTAAKSLAAAVAEESPGADVRVAEPMALGCPRLTATARRLYMGLIHRLPWAWQLIYDKTDASDPVHYANGLLAGAARWLRDTVADFRPDCVVTTYFLYTGFWADLYQGRAPCPFHTVVTDSINVNSVWVHGYSDSWCVSDPWSADRLELLGVPPERVQVTGFPVSPRFSALPRDLAPPAAGEPFKVLVFPIGSRRRTRRLLDALSKLPPTPVWQATVVLGKHKAQLQPMVVAAIRDRFLPQDTEILGWTDRVPELLATHHLLVGKAGGATVHEARTAARPMLVHYAVPGQEYGNVRLLELEGGGRLVATPEEFVRGWSWLTDNHFAGWRQARDSLVAAAVPDPSRRTARHILGLPPAP